MRPSRFQKWLRFLAFSGWLVQAAVVPAATVLELDNPTGPGKITVTHLTPVEYFRQLLAAPPSQRDALLAGRTPEQKKIILAKIQEYEQMPAEERELRLHHTDLRWHLLELMKTSVSERAARLAEVPAADRPLIEERLRQWDAIAPEVQTEFLNNEATVAAYLEKQGASPQTNAAPSSVPTRQQTLDAELNRLESLPENQRQRMFDLFRQFFDWDEKEKQKTLNELSQPQREQIVKAMQGYANLTPEERRQRIEALRKFLSMSPAARKQFLENAARWRAMSSSEHVLWRQMVKQLPPMPPLPPGLATRLTPPLPSPPLPLNPAQQTGVSTNAVK